MKKTLVTTVLACAMTIFGFAASLQADESDGQAKAKTQYSTQSLMILDKNKADGVNLTANLVKVPSVEGKTFGYLLGGKFVSLENVIDGVRVDTAELPYNQLLSFGFGSSASDFVPREVSFNVSSDPGYYAGYQTEGFYQLDFSEKPFDGYFEIVIGKPLPAPAVTLVVALAAGALFLLYKNRRQHSFQFEQE